MKSNCILEAVKAKIRNPKYNKIYKRGSWFRIFKMWLPHFYWYNKQHNKYYSFRQRDIITYMQQLWYEGDIVEFIPHEHDI